jgi:hypothetical protein
LGLALLSGCVIFIAGKCDQCIFTWMEQCRKFETDNELVEFLAQQAK